MNTPPKIQNIKQQTLLDPNTRQNADFVVVTFMVGSHGPFTEIFPKATFDPPTINAKLQDFANKLANVNLGG
jgi:hypothetical protein